MASPLFIRAASVYLNGKKIGTCSKGSKDKQANGSLVPGDGGIAIGWAKGMTTNTLNLDFALTFAGNTETKALEDALDTGSAVKMQVGVLDGKISAADYFVDSMKADWDHEKGTCTGSCVLKAGADVRT